MKRNSRLPFLVGTVLLSASLPLNAQPIKVLRCNVLSDGVFRPALIIRGEGKDEIFTVGEQNLSRRAIFNRDAALAFVARVKGLAASDLNYEDCTAAAGSSGAAQRVGLVVPPPPPPDGGDTGGCGPDYAN